VAPPIPEGAPITKRGQQFTPYCGGGAGDTANVDDVIACFNYMVKIGNSYAWIPLDGDQHIQCTAGTAAIYAVDYELWPFTSAA